MKRFSNPLVCLSSIGRRSFTTSVAYNQLCRSYMYVPGDKSKMLSKIASVTDLSPDIAIFDLEDAVDIKNKDLARANILSLVKSGKLNDNHRSSFCIRMNSISYKSLIEKDLQLIADCLKVSSDVYPSIICLSKVANKDDLTELYQQFKNVIDVGNIKNPIKLDIMIESCQAISNLNGLFDHFSKTNPSCFTLNNVIFGSDDYCASMGLSRSSSNMETLYARQHLVNVTKAYKLFPIDMVDIDIQNVGQLYNNSKFGASLGFVGKQVIHPKQLEIVHKCFTPTDDKIDWATNLLKEYEIQKAQKSGVFVFMGSMIDMPTIIQAKHLVEVANLIKQSQSKTN